MWSIGLNFSYFQFQMVPNQLILDLPTAIFIWDNTFNLLSNRKGVNFRNVMYITCIYLPLWQTLYCQFTKNANDYEHFLRHWSKICIFWLKKSSLKIVNIFVMQGSHPTNISSLLWPHLIPQCSHKSLLIAWVTHRLLDDMPPKKNSYLQTKILSMTSYLY